MKRRGGLIHKITPNVSTPTDSLRYRLERAYDDEARVYASLSLEILNQIPKEEIEKSEELNKCSQRATSIVQYL